MIVSGGENVFPREVEDLLADHEAVVEVAVIGVDDEEFGQRLKAFVVVAAEPRSAEDELKAHVKANLASYKAPREIEFLDELPRNATGKILKRELREREAQQSGVERRAVAQIAAFRTRRGGVASGARSRLRRHGRTGGAAASGRRGDRRRCTASPSRRWSGCGSARSGSPRPRRGPRGSAPS